MTTEILSAYFWGYLQGSLPLKRIRLYENDNFFVEYNDQAQTSLGLLHDFHSAHRLHSPHLDDQTNIAVYDKCNNLYGHGHLYRVETTITGAVDSRTGSIANLANLNKNIETVLDDWNYKHLNLDTDEFKNMPTTGENIIARLWHKLEKNIDSELVRLRLWETPNNRFSLRKTL